MARLADHITIGELAARSGVAASALRFYEQRGLIRSERTAGNQRRYARSQLRRVAFVRAAQRVGLSIDEIREAMSTLPDNRTPTKADWARLSAGWQDRLDAQIRELELLKTKLTGCIGCGCLSLRRCALSNPDDVVADRGPGAVYLRSGDAT
jgi:MerR family transcriptional regulator, redox-sensitive transcriptional activator SoxR